MTKYTRADIDAFMERCRHLHLKRTIIERYDRCCHGGIVSQRLPFMFCVDVANYWGSRR